MRLPDPFQRGPLPYRPPAGPFPTGAAAAQEEVVAALGPDAFSGGEGAGPPGTLHRIAALRNRKADLVGLWWGGPWRFK